ncbi:uncharacterized protein FIBRA_07963 [Fibroporia radiculosa]|uniref:SH3 domain-containing protein n=1 Tax=Fibroporia radiculosa TaxID=599839 RepID=J4IC37_9APHY|nr:uncharacterized protein FIBRA_07963 [Fibroporia radiculosa]CCM05731.1 predicted protein [Fibroporia radiculosa]
MAVVREVIGELGTLLLLSWENSNQHSNSNLPDYHCYPDGPNARLSLSINHPPSSSPFPSPGSPFLPPPRLGAHEFALRSTTKRNSAQRHKSEDHMDENSTPTAASMKTTFARTDVSPPTTPTMNGNGLVQTTPPATPTITIPEPQTPEPVLVHHNSLTSSRPAPPSPAVSRRASTALSRRSSAARSRRQSKVPQSLHDSEASTSSTATATVALQSQQKRRSLLVKIRDFAFPKSDDRHVGRGSDVPRANRPRHRSSAYSTASSSSASSKPEEDVLIEDQRGSWSSAFRWNALSSHFSWGSSNASAAPNAEDGPSRMDFERNFDASSPMEEGPDPYENDFTEDDEVETYPSEDAPPVPGLYRALFSFEPEGTAEMALEEEQIVHIIGRGGGVGWAVVEKDDGGHALVPESYLELVKPDTD